MRDGLHVPGPPAVVAVCDLGFCGAGQAWWCRCRGSRWPGVALVPGFLTCAVAPGHVRCDDLASDASAGGSRRVGGFPAGPPPPAALAGERARTWAGPTPGAPARR